MMTLLFFLGINGLLNGFGNFLNGLFGAGTGTSDPTLVGAYGNLYDLPNSNIVELPPELPTTQNPIAVSVPTNPFSNFFNYIGSLFGSSGTGTVTSSVPSSPLFTPFGAGAVAVNAPPSQYYP
jgi:hypothetical protein